MNNISSFLSYISSGNLSPFATNTQDIAPSTTYSPYSLPPYPLSHFPPLNSETHPIPPRLDSVNTQQ